MCSLPTALHNYFFVSELNCLGSVGSVLRTTDVATLPQIKNFNIKEHTPWPASCASAHTRLSRLADIRCATCAAVHCQCLRSLHRQRHATAWCRHCNGCSISGLHAVTARSPTDWSDTLNAIALSSPASQSLPAVAASPARRCMIRGGGHPVAISFCL